MEWQPNTQQHHLKPRDDGKILSKDTKNLLLTCGDTGRKLPRLSGNEIKTSLRKETNCLSTISFHEGKETDVLQKGVILERTPGFRKEERVNTDYKIIIVSNFQDKEPTNISHDVK